MKRIVFNDNNIKEEDVEFEAIRVKGIVINSKNEVLIAHNNNTYQFIGGHVEKEEDITDALERELKEETGICNYEINGPFMLIENYLDSYFNVQKIVHSKIYYYIIKTEDLPNIDNTNYDILEQQTDFKLFYIGLESLPNFLKDALKKDMIEEIIYKEMILVIEEFNRIYGGVEY